MRAKRATKATETKVTRPVRLSPDVHQDLSTISEKSGFSMGDLADSALRPFIAEIKTKGEITIQVGRMVASKAGA